MITGYLNGILPQFEVGIKTSLLPPGDLVDASAVCIVGMKSLPHESAYLWHVARRPGIFAGA